CRPRTAVDLTRLEHEPAVAGEADDLVEARLFGHGGSNGRMRRGEAARGVPRHAPSYPRGLVRSVLCSLRGRGGGPPEPRGCLPGSGERDELSGGAVGHELLGPGDARRRSLRGRYPVADGFAVARR